MKRISSGRFWTRLIQSSRIKPGSRGSACGILLTKSMDKSSLGMMVNDLATPSPWIFDDEQLRNKGQQPEMRWPG
jgi:hypothetical protein